MQYTANWGCRTTLPCGEPNPQTLNQTKHESLHLTPRPEMCKSNPLAGNRGPGGLTAPSGPCPRMLWHDGPLRTPPKGSGRGVVRNRLRAGQGQTVGQTAQEPAHCDSSARTFLGPVCLPSVGDPPNGHCRNSAACFGPKTTWPCRLCSVQPLALRWPPALVFSGLSTGPRVQIRSPGDDSLALPNENATQRNSIVPSWTNQFHSSAQFNSTQRVSPVGVSGGVHFLFWD